jgi:hypothetical protein
LGFKNEYGFTRKGKRFDFGLKRGKKNGIRIYPQSVNSTCKQYCERKEERRGKRTLRQHALIFKTLNILLINFSLLYNKTFI